MFTDMPDIQRQKTDSNSDLVARLRRRSLARLISLVENKSADVLVSLGSLGLSPGSGYVVGVTGPPGAGKSTLVDQLIRVYRRRGDEVAVVAVDPTSPFSGGAVLGDRI